MKVFFNAHKSYLIKINTINSLHIKSLSANKSCSQNMCKFCVHLSTSKVACGIVWGSACSFLLHYHIQYCIAICKLINILIQQRKTLVFGSCNSKILLFIPVFSLVYNNKNN